MLFHKLVLGPMQNNCYFIVDEYTNNAIMIDAPFDGETICAFLMEHNYTLKYIIITHAHFDHITALNYVKSQHPNAEVLIHENGVDALNNPNINMFADFNFIQDKTKVDKSLKDRDILEIGNIKLEILHTPGHTSDSICILTDNILFSGDTLFYHQVGRCDLPTGDLNTEIISIKEKLMALNDNIQVYPGHDKKTSIGEERAQNPYLLGGYKY